MFETRKQLECGLRIVCVVFLFALVTAHEFLEQTDEEAGLCYLLQRQQPGAGPASSFRVVVALAPILHGHWRSISYGHVLVLTAVIQSVMCQVT